MGAKPQRDVWGKGKLLWGDATLGAGGVGGRPPVALGPLLSGGASS